MSSSLAAVALILCGQALAAPGDALDPFSREFYDQAVAEEGRGGLAKAKALYRLLHERDPTFTPAGLGLGRVLEAEGRTGEAEALYRTLGLDPDAVEALARLVAPGDPDEALALYAQLESLRLGDASPFCAETEWFARSSTEHPERIEYATAAWERCVTLSGGRQPPLGPLVVLLEAMADPDEIARLTEDALVRWPDSTEAPALKVRLDRLEVERSARSVVLGGAEPLSVEDAVRLAEARSFLATDRARSRAIAESLLERAPRSADAHAVLADAAFDQDWAAAEIHALLARDLDPEVAGNHLRVARVFHLAYGGRRDAEALVALRQAAALRPDEPAILLQVAGLEQSQRQWPLAIAALRRWLEISPDSGDPDAARDVQARLAALQREAPPVPPVPPVPAAAPAPHGALPGISDEAASAWRVALVYLDRGDLAAARVELDKAMGLAPGVAALFNVDARLRREGGDVAGAIAAWERSLGLDPLQGDVQLALGETLDAKGEVEPALQHYRLAAVAGEAEAHYFLARSAGKVGDWQTTRTELAAFEAGGGRVSLYSVAAQRLRAQADQHVWRVRLVGAGLLAMLVGLPAGLWAWRRGGVDLRDFLDRAPGAWHDAARLLAAIRHEVLKHNTTVLPDIARALEQGDRRSWDSWRVGAADLVLRFDSYVAALESLGGQHGVRLAAHRDPILAPMRASLISLVRASGRARPPRCADLRAHAEVLNGRGYTALGTLVTEICILPVNPALIHTVYDRVSAEPGFGGDTPPLVVSGHPGQVRMFRGDLEDILANLFRNALSAGATQVDVVLAEDSDPITGHSWFELRVQDDAPGQLTTAMIRGRYISRGLGLAVDLLNRHGGTIRVDAYGPEEQRMGGRRSAERPRKAVVVQLPAVEAAAVEVEWR
ncbi:MAG: tetratricopeptide repeat protein [Myxococcales bacterium]|nr:tetratricopeptide repeat protein [Myxococcales bacterium]